jgi:SAM-dependent methyltransferase
VQEADKWSTNAKEYVDLSKKIPIVTHFSDLTAEICAGAIHLSADMKFFDACAGPATFSISIMKNIGLEHSKSIQFVITDFSSGMVDAAKEAVDALVPAHPNVEFKLTDVQDIDEPPDKFDAVGCMFGYFVPDRKKAFSEVCRICKPGGKAVVGTWKYVGFAYILSDFLAFLGQDGMYPGFEMAHCCADGDKLKAELAAVGFSEVVVHECTKVFDMALEDDTTMALFHNPMIRAQLASFDREFLLAEWYKFMRLPDLKYEVDLKENVLKVPYTANIVIATK